MLHLLKLYKYGDCTDVLSSLNQCSLYFFLTVIYLPVGLFHLSLVSLSVHSEHFDLNENRFRNRIGFIHGNAEVEILSNVPYLKIRIVSVSAPKRYNILC